MLHPWLYLLCITYFSQVCKNYRFEIWLLHTSCTFNMSYDSLVDEGTNFPLPPLSFHLKDQESSDYNLLFLARVFGVGY